MNFTYSEIYNFVYEKLRSAYNWTIQILTESVYANLISAFSYGVEQLAFYDEILTKESIFKTAELTSSINYISWMLNYTPHRKIGASSLAYVSADPSFNLRSGEYTYTDLGTTISKWTPIIGPSINAYATEDVNIPSGTTVYHYNLPVKLGDVTGKKEIILINDDGVAIVPVTVDPLTVNEFDNNPSTQSLVGVRKIQVGTYVNIKGSALYSGEYLVVSIPTDNATTYSPLYHIAIQTNYFAEKDNINLIEKIQLGTILSTGQIRLPIREGIPLEYIYTATGAVNEKIPVFSPNIDNDYYEVYIVTTQEVTINGITTYATTIVDTVTVLNTDAFLVNDLAKYYCTVYNDPEFRYIYFEFGDNIKTRKLTTGQQVLIRYAETVGDLGNTTSLDIINNFGENLISTNGIPVTGLYVTNVSSFIGGSDYETPESIKFNSRVRFNESNLLISNWTPIINKHPSVLKSRVYTERDIDPYSTELSKQNIVNISALNKAGKQILSGSIEANNIIYLYLRQYSSPTDVIIFQDTHVIQVRAIIYYKTKPTNTVIFFSNVIDGLKNTYDIYNVDYAVSLYASNVLKIVESASSDLIYARVKLSYLESSITNRYLFNNTPYVYLTGTYKNNILSKDSFLDLTTGNLSLWIRRKINGSYQKWIQIGEQIGSTLKFITSTIYNYTNRIKQIEYNLVNQNFGYADVGDILCYLKSANQYKLASSTDELDSNITQYFYIQSYNNNTSKFTIIEAGPIVVTGLVSIDTINNPNPYHLKDEDGVNIIDNKPYYLSDTPGKLVKDRGTSTRKFMLKKVTIPGDVVNNGIIPKGFYFNDCIIGQQNLYSTLNQDPKFCNYIQDLNIDTITYQLVPNSNQLVINTQNNTTDADISYITQFNTNLTTTITEQDILNPSEAQLKGYELRIIYNTQEKLQNPIYTNDVRLPYFTNILDVQSDNIEFIED